jgi:DNA polymerase-1
MDKTLYIIDAHALIYRAYYAFIRRPLLTTGGENTSAIFGFMRMVMKMMNDEKPEYLVCVFDSREKTFRHELYGQYKAKRLVPPEDLGRQADTIRGLVTSIGLAGSQKDGFEADDLIGTMVLQARESGFRSVIVSSDKDILQLVSDQVTVYANKKGISDVDIMDREKVHEIWGVWPENMRDLLALMGDQSDNVPGVRGIGQTTAVKLIRQFGSIEKLFENLDQVESERTRGLLRRGKEEALLSRQLVSIRTDVPIRFEFSEFGIRDFPKAEGIDILMEKELNTLVSELRGSRLAYRTHEPARGTYMLVAGSGDFTSLKPAILAHRPLSVDTESTGVDPMSARLIGVSLSSKEGEGYYLPIRTREGNDPGVDFLMNELKPLLEDGEIEKVGQNIKYDLVLLMQEGIHMRGIAGDSMIAAYLLNPQKQRYSLDDLAQEYLDYRTIHYEDVVRDKGKTLLDYPLQEVVQYAGEDADIALRLHNVLLKKLEEERFGPLYRDVEIPLVAVLGKMERTGVRIDSSYLEQMSREFSGEIQELEKKIFAIAGCEFNVRSTKQLSAVLYEKLGLPVTKRTKTGISTDESVLEQLARSHEIARLLLRHRTLTKLKSTYVDSLPALVNPSTGRVHTSFNQTIAATGRLSSSNPNLQNIPIREPAGRAIRRAFVPEDGWVFVSADYSQVELRILASLSGDEALRAAFEKDADIHRETAAGLFGIPAGNVQDEQRQTAKTINFSVIYGISPFGLGKSLGITKTEAADFIDAYFARYSGVKKFFDALVEDAKAKGFVETILGRRRYVPDINSQNTNIYESARRIVINTPVQGSAADLIKKAMVIIDRELSDRGMQSRMLIQVHDELVFESPREEFRSLVEMVKDRMEHALELSVPLKVNVAVGHNWEEAH